MNNVTLENEWNDTVVELVPVEFVTSVNELPPNDDPEPPDDSPNTFRPPPVGNSEIRVITFP